MALVPDGALMRRAAAGLASVAASLLRQEPGHLYGARVVLLVGTGDNGGDALYAGRAARPAGRGRHRDRGRAAPAPRRRRRAAGRRRPVRGRRAAARAR